MQTLKENYVVQKRNVLNEFRPSNMTLQELRFFAIYLSRINKDEISTRAVRFTLNEFQSIMELGSRIKTSYMKIVTTSLLCKVVNVPNKETGGYMAFQLFKRCRVDKDGNGEWYVEIDAHDDALPLMFEYKNKYFSYKVFNVLRLRSTNQFRMYELLKQYENTKDKSRVMSVVYLKEQLGIEKNEYPRYGDFKTHVLNVCQRAINEYTDIKFTFEPDPDKKRVGRGGKINYIKFYIEKNNDYSAQMTVDMFLNQSDQEPNAELCPDDDTELFGIELIGEPAKSELPDDRDDDDELTPYEMRVATLMEACFNEFTEKQILVLYGEMSKTLDDETLEDDIRCFEYLRAKYRELEMRDEKSKIEHRFAYLRSLIKMTY
jgi:plasmid replication initiation protein